MAPKRQGKAQAPPDAATDELREVLIARDDPEGGDGVGEVPASSAPAPPSSAAAPPPSTSTSTAAAPATAANLAATGSQYLSSSAAPASGRSLSTGRLPGGASPPPPLGAPAPAPAPPFTAAGQHQHQHPGQPPSQPQTQQQHPLLANYHPSHPHAHVPAIARAPFVGGPAAMTAAAAGGGGSSRQQQLLSLLGAAPRQQKRVLLPPPSGPPASLFEDLDEDAEEAAQLAAAAAQAAALAARQQMMHAEQQQQQQQQQLQWTALSMPAYGPITPVLPSSYFQQQQQQQMGALPLILPGAGGAGGAMFAAPFSQPQQPQPMHSLAPGPAGAVFMPQPPMQQPSQQPPAPSEPQGRVTVICLAEAFDRAALEGILRSEAPSAVRKEYAEVLHVQLSPLVVVPGARQRMALAAAAAAAQQALLPASAAGQQQQQDRQQATSSSDPQQLQAAGSDAAGKAAAFAPAAGPQTTSVLQWPEDAFFFEWGVVVTWGLTPEREAAITALAVRAAAASEGGALLPEAQRETDYFSYAYSDARPPSMTNDVITITRRQAASGPQVKLAIAFALAQSTKLCVYEQRVTELVAATRHLPVALAQEGAVRLPPREVARLIGRVFLLRSAVTLLSPVLDSPDFFWDQPDDLQRLYDVVFSYLEVSSRVDVLDARLAVLNEVLDLVRQQQSHSHTSHLEVIIIVLILVEVVLGLAQLMGLFKAIG